MPYRLHNGVAQMHFLNEKLALCHRLVTIQVPDSRLQTRLP